MAHADQSQQGLRALLMDRKATFTPFWISDAHEVTSRTKSGYDSWWSKVSGRRRRTPTGRSVGRTPAEPGTDEHRRCDCGDLRQLGFEAPLARDLFVLSRSVGILAHA
ncbi:hypothetical protein ABTY98_40575 [Streptomyces sp. NPDC096040]|uniref:hypothetical protein n=1 Tax=Streptomyces sp. NPDC096040 TaxID=3155541 RepID=UPI003316C013